MTACGKVKSEDSSNKDTNGKNNEMNNEEVFFGKISAIMGNEFEVSIANDPFEGVEETVGETDDEEGAQASMSTPASDGVAPEGEDYGAEDRIELEYTGETKTFTIPAGVEICKSNGEEVKLPSVKKGEVISIKINKKTGAVSRVIIWG